MVTREGTRPLLVEVQALVDPVQGGVPRRLAVGLDAQRLSLLLAVLHRHGGVETAGFDVFVNAVGGVRILEPAADLAVLSAIDSSLKNRALPNKSIVFGEVGLAPRSRADATIVHARMAAATRDAPPTTATTDALPAAARAQTIAVDA
jgi:DNA repair protein RadA/Sms